MDNIPTFPSKGSHIDLKFQKNGAGNLTVKTKKELLEGSRLCLNPLFQGTSARPYGGLKLKNEVFLKRNSISIWLYDHETENKNSSILAYKDDTENKLENHGSCVSVKRRFFNVISKLYLTKKFINILRGQNSKLTPKFLSPKHFNIINDLSFFYDVWKKSFARKTLEKKLSFFDKKTISSVENALKKTVNFLHDMRLFDNSMGFIIFWNSTNAIIIMFFFLIIPLELCFDIKLSQEYENFNSIYYISFAFFLMDINTVIYKKGKFIRNRLDIMREYFKNRFLFDLIALLIILLEIYEDYTSLNSIGGKNLFFKLVKLLFFSKYVRFSSIVKKLEEMLFIDESMYNILSLFKLILRIVFISHMFACIWYYIGTINSENSWILDHSLENSPWYVKYLNSYYFVCITMNTVGYGDITPKNPLEKIFSIIFTYMACGIFAYSLNRIGFIVSEIAKREKLFQGELNVINGFMKKKNINSDLKIRVRKYLEYIWYEDKVERLEEEGKIIQKLSDSLKEELQLEANGSVLRDLKMFSFNFSEDFLSSMIPYLKEVRYTPEDIIYMKGDHESQDLYIILNGMVELFYESTKTNEKCNVLKTLTKGETFGEISFFSDQERETCAKSVDFTTFYCINKNDFLSLIRKFDEDYQKFCEIKDSIKNNKDTKLLYIRCFSCNEPTHLTPKCPLVTPNLLKNLVLAKYLHPTPQPRNNLFRRTRKKSNFCKSTRQMIYQAMKIRKILEIDENDINDEENDSFESLENIEHGSISDIKGPTRKNPLEIQQKRSSIYRREEDSLLKRTLMREESALNSQNFDNNKNGVLNSSNNLSNILSNQNLDENLTEKTKLKKFIHFIEDMNKHQKPTQKKNIKFIPNDDLDLMKSWDAYFPRNNLEEVMANKFNREMHPKLTFFMRPKKDTFSPVLKRRLSVIKKKFFQNPAILERMLKEGQFDVKKFREQYVKDVFHKSSKNLFKQVYQVITTCVGKIWQAVFI